MIELEVVPFDHNLDLLGCNVRASWQTNHRRVKNPGVLMSGHTFLIEGQPYRVLSVDKFLSNTQRYKDTYVVRIKSIVEKPKRMQCKHLSDIKILSRFSATSITTVVMFRDLNLPPNLLRAKCIKLFRRGFLEEYMNSSYKLTDKGLLHLAGSK